MGGGGGSSMKPQAGGTRSGSQQWNSTAIFGCSKRYVERGEVVVVVVVVVAFFRWL